MAKTARTLIVVAALSLCFAAGGSARPQWAQDYPIMPASFSQTQRGVCAINDSVAWSTGKYYGPHYYLFKRKGGLYSHEWDWVQLDGLYKYQMNDVFFIDEDHGWAVGYKWDTYPLDPPKYSGIILWTNHGGASWNAVIPSLPLPTPFYAVRFANPLVGYIACGNGLVLWSDDGGQTWAPTDSMPSSRPDSLSECYTGLWVAPYDPGRVWVCGDNSGIVAKTADGGVSWEESWTPAFTHYYSQPEINGRLANFELSAADPLRVHLALSHGRLGRTTDGGSTWDAVNLEPEETWFYGLDYDGGTTFLVGSRGVAHAYPGGQEHFSPHYNLYGVDMAPNSSIGYAVGSVGLLDDCGIRQRYDPVGIDTVMLSYPDSNIVRIEWRTTFENNAQKWEVLATRSNYLLEYPSTIILATYEAHGPDSLYEWEADYTNWARAKYYFQLHLWTKEEEPGPPVSPPLHEWFYVGETDTIGKPDTVWNSIPDPPTNLVASDNSPDHGGIINLSWEPSSSPGIERYAVGRTRHPDSQYVWIGTVDDTVSTLDDSTAQNGVSYWYVVMARNMYHWSEYSNPESAIAADDLAPDPVPDVRAGYDPVNAADTVRWDPAPEPNMGGYWVCCPPLPSGEPDPAPPGSVLNVSPIDRTWYVTQVDHGGNWGYMVGAMDRSGNFSGWCPGDWVVVSVPYISVVDNIKATAENSAVRMVRTGEDTVHAVFTSGDSVYHSWSPDEVYWHRRQAIGKGSCPALALAEGILHVCWVENSLQKDAKLWYRSYDISTGEWDGGRSPPPIFTTSGTNYHGISPPSLDVYDIHAKVTWQCLQSSTPIPDPDPPGQPVNLDDLGSFLLCGSFATTDPSGTFWHEEVDSFGQGPCTVILDTLMEHTPSLAYEPPFGLHIAWEHDGSALRHYERTPQGWNEDTISSGSAHRVKDPQIGLQQGIIACVWAEKTQSGPFNIWAAAKQSEEWDWDRQPVCSTGDDSESPVFSKNNVAWHELSGGATEVFLSQREEFGWTDPENISNSPWGDSKYPQIIYVESEVGPTNPYLCVQWSQSHPMCHTVQFKTRTVLSTPLMDADVGLEEPSPITLQRDGYTQHGSRPHETLDRGNNRLTYQIGHLEGDKYEHKLRFLFYHEGGGRQVEVAVDSIPLGTVWLEPHAKTWVEEMVPDECLADSVITVEVSKKTPDRHAVLSGLELYRYKRRGGGGAQSAGSGGAPKLFSLSQNYPNPFVAGTVIRYGLPRRSQVELKVYDVTGRLVNTLVDGEHQPGFHIAAWNGKDSSNRQVASGVYFYRLEAGDPALSGAEVFTATKKLVLLR